MLLNRKLWAVVLSLLLFISTGIPVRAEPSISSPSVVLMESSTGQIIYEVNATERRSPASITKIMTLLLTFEAIGEGRVKLTDDVLVSEHASSMGGSQVYLAQGEVQSLETMIKCIVVSSGNDASVAVAEHIAGSETAFVEMMNKKAVSLGMMDTHFEDCCGLTDSDNHYSCARDVAIMSRELTIKYPKIFDYTKIWMEDISHETKQGTVPFTLSSTNKLLKQYQYATGLKTGMTSKAKFCLSATATKDGIDLIAVVMGAEDSKTRFGDAQALLTYGFGICKVFKDENKDALPELSVERGVEETVPLSYEGPFHFLDIKGNDLSGMEKELVLPQKVTAPVICGEQAGKAIYRLNGKDVGEVALLYGKTVEKARYADYFKKVLSGYLM